MFSFYTQNWWERIRTRALMMILDSGLLLWQPCTYWYLLTGADWAACHLPGGPVGRPARWAATWDVKEGMEWRMEPLDREGGLYSEKLFAGAPEFPVKSLPIGLVWRSGLPMFINYVCQSELIIALRKADGYAGYSPASACVEVQMIHWVLDVWMVLQVLCHRRIYCVTLLALSSSTVATFCTACCASPSRLAPWHRRELR